VLTQRSGVTHNYVVIEAEALIHRRRGANPARRLLQDIIPLLDIIWITPDLHATTSPTPDSTPAPSCSALGARNLTPRRSSLP
jgi:hypothetical protein